MNKTFTQIFLITILLLGALTACESNGSDADETVEPTTSSVSDTSTEETATLEAEPTEEAVETEVVAAEAPTEESTEEAEQTDVPTEEAVVAVDSLPTVEMIVTSENLSMSNISDTGEFAFVVASMNDPYESEQLPPSDDARVVLMRVALTNNSGTAITSTLSSVQAVDAEGTRYPAEEPTEATEPTLINVEIPAGETLTGLVHFIIPDDKEVVGVEWCPTSSCDQPLSMSFR